MALTGHVLCEEILRYQTACVGSCMRHYEHMQAPGMDLIYTDRREHTTARQVSSRRGSSVASGG